MIYKTTCRKYRSHELQFKNKSSRRVSMKQLCEIYCATRQFAVTNYYTYLHNIRCTIYYCVLMICAYKHIYIYIEYIYFTLGLTNNRFYTVDILLYYTCEFVLRMYIIKYIICINYYKLYI